MNTIIITIIICQLISLIGLIMWDKSGFIDEWLILCCPIFLIPLLIIRTINMAIFHRPIIKVLKRHKTGERYEMWTKYNRKTKIYETELNQKIIVVGIIYYRYIKVKIKNKP